jgi:hypothetical protein
MAQTNLLKTLPLVAALALATPAGAMTINRTHLDGIGDVIDLQGDIKEGNGASLRAYLNSIPEHDRRNIVAFRLDSLGGSVGEAAEMADAIANTRRGTIVGEDNVCVSACVFLFAAGNERLVSSTARIGVHRSHNANGESQGNVIGFMAKVAKRYGVPDSIITQMVTTDPDAVTWLTRADYAAWNVEVVEAKVASASAPAAPTPGPWAALGGTASVSPVSQAFADGKRDRLSMQQWVDKQSGEYRAGIEYWASVRSHQNENPGCVAAAPNWEWLNGCKAAKATLDPLDARRNREPDYKAGWNQASEELGG